MRLFVGLGNPGRDYALHRHNIGFMAVDRIAADHGFSPWRKGFQGLVSEGRLGLEKVVLLKPQTFMNLSGQSVGEAMRFWKLAPHEVTVFHDELDLAPFRLRVKAGGGHAGHNGLRSLHAHIGEGYARVRIGIGHPGHKDRVAGHVLSDFAKDEAEGLEELLRGISEGAPALAMGETDRFQSAVALRTAPPRSGGSGAGGREGKRAPRPVAGPAPGASGSSGAGAPPPGAARPDPAAAPGIPREPGPDTPGSAPPDPATPDDPPEARTALQRLVDRFR